MPQFDQFSFFNQVSWFLFFFFNFYFFITYFFLPKICYNIKFRKKKIIFDNNKQNVLNLEKNNNIIFKDYSFKTFFSFLELYKVQQLSLYKKNQNIKIQETPILNHILKEKINFFLNQKFLLFKKIFINI
nr:ATP synthase F0 subunit 8 [Nothophytophthora sp.]